jgi:hypothetical protein
MKQLITDIDVLRKYLRLTFVTNNAILPNFEDAQRLYLLPILGKDLLAAVAQEAEDDPAEPSDLLHLCRRVVAPIGYWLNLPFIQVTISDAGVGSNSNQNFQSAHRWEYEQLEAALINKGCMALEDLLTYLYEEKPEDVSWLPPISFPKVIKSGKEFNDFFAIYQPYRTFESLRAIVKSVESTIIEAEIGEAFFNSLIANATPSADEKKAIRLIKEAVVNRTIQMACDKLPVRISSEGFTVALRDNKDMKNQGQQSAPVSLTGDLKTNCTNSGNAAIGELKKLLNSKASSTVFAEYFNGNYYEAPTATTSINENSNTFFL